MINFIFKVTVYGGMLAVIFVAATGLVSMSPGVAVFPFFFIIFVLPVVLFAITSNRLIFLETARRIGNRGFEKVARQIELKGRNLDHIDVQNINLNRLNLESFSLRSADLEGAKMIKTRAIKSDFTKAFMPRVKMSLGNFSHARFIKANLKKSRMRYGNFKNADFTEADLRGCNLKGANLSGANLKEADIQGSIFNNKTIWPFSREEAIKRGAIAVS